ncbi:MAG: hypothetical protein LBC53_06655 [Spirochaetaceae bacterium]|jgi:Asp-tRNA(Asn)/Glu-tRNA(Gln) amidotransferase A subunit family amidase|nr:hypothetical protein [Spirochaetaceae bacterium]
MESSAEYYGETAGGLNLEKIRTSLLASRKEAHVLFKEATKKLREAVEQIKENGLEIDKKLADAAMYIERSEKKHEEAKYQLKLLEKSADLYDCDGRVNLSTGKMIEVLISARFWENAQGYQFNRVYQRIPIYDESSSVITDIDVLFVNEAFCVAVEVKGELNNKYEVDEHLKRMELIRGSPPEMINEKTLIGAISGGMVQPDIKNYAYKSGIFVLEFIGEQVELLQPPEGFEPKNW